VTAPLVVYGLCFVTSVLCAVLLIRAHASTKRRFLLWCALSFGLLAANNTFVLVDLLWFPDGDLVAFRQTAALLAVGVLIYGFMWEAE
jgi:hypothetical protein